jgi:hypothetical protein
MSAAHDRPDESRLDAPGARVRRGAWSENWYVYYAAPNDGSALARVRSMQEALSRGSAVRARLEERVATETPTWMEVYEGVNDPEAFALTLDAALGAHRVAELVGARHIERFRCL